VADLETVDIPAVEILASGGPVYAIGSPPEGDFYTRDELEAIALAHRELGNEIRAPIKLGHSDRQQLLANSGLTKGEMPAAGWLDSGSFRVEDDAETGVAKLLADARSVPKKIADLMNVGASGARSSESREDAASRSPPCRPSTTCTGSTSVRASTGLTPTRTSFAARTRPRPSPTVSRPAR
jgi:hypothetical protein